MKSPELQRRKLPYTWAIVVASIIGVALGSMSLTAYAQDAGLANIRVTVSAPTQVKVGDIIHLRLQSDGNVEVGGFETLVLYSHADAEFAGFAPASPVGDVSTGQLVAPEMALGSAVGYYSCATAPCLAQRALQVQAAAQPGLLADVQLLALTTGELEVNFAHLQIVDRSGLPIPVEASPSSVIIQVGDGGQRHNAPVDAWNLNGNGGSAAIASVTAADVTRDGAVSHSDIMDIAMAWETVHEAGQPCDGREISADINADGCVDIVDVQSAAAYAGNLNQPSTNADQQGSNKLYLPQTGNGTAAVARAAGLKLIVNSTGDQNDSDTTDGICQTTAHTCTLRRRLTRQMLLLAAM